MQHPVHIQRQIRLTRHQRDVVPLVLGQAGLHLRCAGFIAGFAFARNGHIQIQPVDDAPLAVGLAVVLVQRRQRNVVVRVLHDGQQPLVGGFAIRRAFPVDPHGHAEIGQPQLVVADGKKIILAAQRHRLAVTLAAVHPRDVIERGFGAVLIIRHIIAVGFARLGRDDQPFIDIACRNGKFRCRRKRANHQREPAKQSCYTFSHNAPPVWIS